MFRNAKYLVQFIGYNKHAVNSTNINNFVKSCLKYNSWNVGMTEDETKHFVLDMVICAFPELTDEIDKYRILI